MIYVHIRTGIMARMSASYMVSKYTLMHTVAHYILSFKNVLLFLHGVTSSKLIFRAADWNKSNRSSL